MSQGHLEKKIGEPTPDEVVQSDISDLPRTVPVTIETPVRVQLPPASLGVHFNVTFPDTISGQRVVSADPKRKRLVLTAFSSIVWIATSQQSAQAKTCFPLAVGAVVEITHKEAVWALPDSAATAILGVIQEQWTN